jgi:hypothetical protein
VAVSARRARAVAAALAGAALLAGAPAHAATPSASVDWPRRTVRCTGTGAPRLREAAGDVVVARLGAERAARSAAVRSCLAALAAVPVGGATLGEALARDPELARRARRALGRYRLAGAPHFYADGGVRLAVEARLDEALAGELERAAAAVGARRGGGAGG